ncbi:TadE/TadG family type IV pilus assembly protein [Pseudoduganella sp. GCM10020061]|uniref:TadE/TadG family type IV pilus assembly protein n=1 Tax=Pseudoduganella sp. GCM10020061 TaxID=3317345 RepID=UPI003641FF19
MNRPQSGATLIEFCLVLLTFLMFMMGLTDLSRLMFIWNAATEATRLGARYAVVCDDTTQKDAVLGRMQQVLPEITDIAVTWEPAGCVVTTCEGVRVTITDLDFQWVTPIPGFVAPNWSVPDFNKFNTYLSREIMRQDDNSATICN